MKKFGWLALSWLALLIIAPASYAQFGDQPTHVTPTLHIDPASIKAGEPFWAAIELKMEPHWHVYWRNPGDSGLEASLKWTLPEGFKADAIHWQTPERIEFATLYNYGYEGETALLIPIQAPDKLSDNLSFGVKMDILVCKDSCIPETHEMTYNVVLGESDVRAQSLIEHYAAQLSKPLPKEASFSAADKTVSVMLDLSGTDITADNIEDIWLFPITDGIYANASDQSWQKESDTKIILTMDRGYADIKSDLLATARITTGETSHWHVIAKQGDVITTAAPTTTSQTPVNVENNLADITLISALISAFLGGLILNIMPCVLPILSLKALGIAKKSQQSPRAVKVMGLAYTAGILVSFATIAGILIALQQAGEYVGWGFQLQSPSFVTSLTYVLFLVGLNLSGIYSLPSVLGNVGQSLTQGESTSSSFFTGVLATLVATPCTAPFMATALGFALGQPPALALIIFLSLGFGLAFPYLLVSFVPPLHRALPKPGAWMDRFKQFLAFPIYATAAWLLWVLVQQSGPMGLAWALSGLWLLALGAWILPILSHNRFLQIGLLLLLAGLLVSTIEKQDLQKQAIVIEESEQEQYFSFERLEKYRNEGTSVFVDATAAWCITCKVNEQIAIKTESVQAAMKENEIITLVADWTNRDDAITRYLASFQRNGVPLYVYYHEGGEPVVLPQILSPQIMLEAFNP